MTSTNSKINFLLRGIVVDPPVDAAGDGPGASLAGGLPGVLRPGPRAGPWVAHGYLRRWCYGAKRSRLQPIKDFVRLVETHWDGIVGWHDSRISNGLLEGTKFTHPGREGQSPRLPQQNQDDHHHYLIAGKLPNQPPYVAHPI